jgi:hypothetical protein
MVELLRGGSEKSRTIAAEVLCNTAADNAITTAIVVAGMLPLLVERLRWQRLG